ncbi:TetR/AcrR family transcriptional regulator [Amycolatopsis jejuensis]|uniref:TetR/AcrR family transcriptional regulator n=1 Tax=Amycolatopsis jejuensis TaxID=330084 RepID=UPI0005258549|nr:TetR/AcrR family transcriptional regulator [Amycolatopsis jejuensis]
MSTSAGSPTRALRGRRLHDAVLDATVARIQAVGAEDTKVADIADAVGVHETSIYRRWKTRPRLLADAVLTYHQRSVPVPDTGSTRTDLLTFFEELNSLAGDPTGATVFTGFMLSTNDPEVNEALSEFFTRRFEAAGAIIERGKQRGDVDPDTDTDLVLYLLGGLIHIHVTHVSAKLEHSSLVSAVDIVLTGIAPRS